MARPVHIESHQGLRQEVWIGPHRLTIDEPREAGGEDAGPTPLELLLAALATWTSITASLYARRQGWALDGVEVDVRHDRLDGKDRIELAMSLGGDLRAEQVARIRAVAERCTIHRLLAGGVEVFER